MSSPWMARNLVNLTANLTGYIFAPAWSPDGNEIASQSMMVMLLNSLYVMDADGQNAHAIVNVSMVT